MRAQKTISLFTAAAILVAYLWSQLQPSDALFLLLSANLLVNIALLGVSVMLVRLSFINKFKTIWGYGLTAGGAAVSLLFGAGGLLLASFSYRFYSWFGPIDFLLLTEFGVILAISALSYEHQPINWQPIRDFTAAKLRGLTPLKPAVTLPRFAFNPFKNLHFN